MTTIYATSSNGHFIVAGRGHADDPIVCSAISATMCGLYNTVHVMFGIITGECDDMEEHGGNATIRFSGGIEAHAVYTMAMETFKLIAAAYPEQIKILPFGGENISEI